VSIILVILVVTSVVWCTKQAVISFSDDGIHFGWFLMEMERERENTFDCFSKKYFNFLYICSLPSFTKNNNYSEIELDLWVIPCDLTVIPCDLTVIPCDLTVIPCDLTVIPCDLTVIPCDLTVTPSHHSP
jgi:hypothetical protein